MRKQRSTVKAVILSSISSQDFILFHTFSKLKFPTEVTITVSLSIPPFLTPTSRVFSFLHSKCIWPTPVCQAPCWFRVREEHGSTPFSRRSVQQRDRTQGRRCDAHKERTQPEVWEGREEDPRRDAQKWHRRRILKDEFQQRSFSGKI